MDFDRSDIKGGLNPDKFQYWLADKRDEMFADKKNGRQDVPFIGRTRTSGARAYVLWKCSFAGHEEFDKTDCARVTLYGGDPDDEVYLLIWGKAVGKWCSRLM